MEKEAAYSQKFDALAYVTFNENSFEIFKPIKKIRWKIKMNFIQGIRTWVNHTVCLFCSFILTATVKIHWAISICVHLSRLLLRLWISIWTKLRYQNSSENKEWLATDKATGVNLHNNKYHTQCLITFGSEIWYFNHEATLLKARKESWYLRREHQNSWTGVSDNSLSHVFKSISVVNFGVWGSVRGLTNIGTESRH